MVEKVEVFVLCIFIPEIDFIMYRSMCAMMEFKILCLFLECRNYNEIMFYDSIMSCQI